ncbi:hypothetical protein LCGC14_1358790 [marine sediment metagenome]|uniref:Uncharacterized protein n=1 Tax=marine sediment metagenome TaxID=412755 RepID=A0A0F9NB12_9ZZZZ
MSLYYEDPLATLYIGDEDMQGLSPIPTLGAIPAPYSQDLPSMCGTPSGGAAFGTTETGEAETEALSGEQQGEGSRIQTPLPNRAGPGEDVGGVPPLLPEPSRSEGEKGRETEGLFKDGEGTQRWSAPSLSPPGATDEGGGNLYHSGMGGGLTDSEAELLLLPQEVHGKPSPDNRPHSPALKGRAPRADEHSGGMSPLQFKQARPSLAALESRGATGRPARKSRRGGKVLLRIPGGLLCGEL